LRRIKPDRRQHLTPRRKSISVAEAAVTGRPWLLLDTNVYIGAAAGLLSDAARTVLDQSQVFHSSICLAELATGVGDLNPTAPDWRRTKDYYTGIIDIIPPSRLIVPDGQVWLDAGLIAGTLSRTQNFQRHQRKECLNDALIYLSAAKAGLTVLTANRDEFDLIQQLAPQGRFMHF